MSLRRTIPGRRPVYSLVLILLALFCQLASASEYHFQDVDERSLVSGLSSVSSFFSKSFFGSSSAPPPKAPKVEPAAALLQRNSSDKASEVPKLLSGAENVTTSFNSSSALNLSSATPAGASSPGSQNASTSSNETKPSDAYASFNITSLSAELASSSNETEAESDEELKSAEEAESEAEELARKAQAETTEASSAGDEEESSSAKETKSGREEEHEQSEIEKEASIPEKNTAEQPASANATAQADVLPTAATVPQTGTVPAPEVVQAASSSNVTAETASLPANPLLQPAAEPTKPLETKKDSAKQESSSGAASGVSGSAELTGGGDKDPVFTISTNISAVDSSLTVLDHQLFTGGEKFCYLQGVCRLGDGTYLLPSWMEKLSGKVRQCGLSKVVYSFHGEASASGNTTLVFKGLPRAKINISDEYKELDIVGGTKPRAEYHLLISDLTPLILLSDIFKRPSAYKNLTTTQCFSEFGDCNSTKVYPSSLNPAILVDSAVSEVKDYLWPKGIVRLLRNGFEGNLQLTDLQDIYGWKFRSHASCFRSLLVTNANTSDFKPKSILADNFMFKGNALSRVPVPKLDQPDQRRRCDMKVLIMNQFQKGHIVGSSVLERALQVLNQALVRRFPHMSLQSETVYFQNSSFHEQISVMQEADVVVASHSASNANLAFLRPGTFFLELLPFGVKPDIFQDIAKAYDVDYHYLHAEPDGELFSKCIAHYNTEAKEQCDYLMGKWNASSEVFVNATRTKKENGKASYFLPEENTDDDNYSDLNNIRECANLQRLSVNVKHLARRVMTQVFDQCGIRTAELQNALFSQIVPS